jgi:protein-tyrosine phosphatase
VATGAALTSAADVDQLVAAGITHVVDATNAENDAPLFASHPAITYCWNPTPDDGQPKPDSYWATTLNFALPMFVQPHTKLYAHCSAGINRGPSNAVCVLMALGWTKSSAMAALKAARPQAQAQYANNAAAAVVSLGYVPAT